MKRIALLVIIALVLIGMFVAPMMMNKGSEDESAALFLFKENLASKWDEVIPISFEVLDSDVEKIEIVYNDTVFKTYAKPKGKIDYSFNAGFFGLGTREIILVSYLDNGIIKKDTRLVRVVSDIQPQRWAFSIENTFPHDASHFTQGLEFDGDLLYQGTGDPSHTGKTLIGTLDLNSGTYTKKNGLDANYFGEGITILGDLLFQLTYTQKTCFVYDKNTLTLLKEFTYTGEGWGLCNDGEYLYMSNGTERITKRDPKTFEVVETLEVMDMTGPIKNLNELEFVDGMIFANVWMTNAVVAIQPETGKVLAVIDASNLANAGQGNGDVLNGIAYSKTNKRFYLTGKYWSKLFEVSLEK
jgi:glutamine cyclotransferase